MHLNKQIKNTESKRERCQVTIVGAGKKTGNCKITRNPHPWMYAMNKTR